MLITHTTNSMLFAQTYGVNEEILAELTETLAQKSVTLGYIHLEKDGYSVELSNTALAPSKHCSIELVYKEGNFKQATVTCGYNKTTTVVLETQEALDEILEDFPTLKEGFDLAVNKLKEIHAQVSALLSQEQRIFVYDDEEPEQYIVEYEDKSEITDLSLLHFAETIRMFVKNRKEELKSTVKDITIYIDHGDFLIVKIEASLLSDYKWYSNILSANLKHGALAGNYHVDSSLYKEDNFTRVAEAYRFYGNRAQQTPETTNKPFTVIDETSKFTVISFTLMCSPLVGLEKDISKYLASTSEHKLTARGNHRARYTLKLTQEDFST